MKQTKSNSEKRIHDSWLAQLEEHKSNPYLVQMVWQEGTQLFHRFAHYCQKLHALPRKWRRAITRKIAPSLAAASLALALGTAFMQAAPTDTITVDGVTCTLADAITAANTDTAVNGCPTGNGADTIFLQSNVNLNTALPSITSEIILHGNGRTIDGQGNNFAVLYNDATGNLTINDVTIMGGSDPYYAGGIINYQGVVAINNSTIFGNQGSGLDNLFGGQMSINNSTIAQNGGSGTGGGIRNRSATLTVSNSTISGNTANYSGGGIHNYEGNVTINQSTITDNSAGSLGGGIANYAYSEDTTINLNQTIVSGNTVGGDISEIWQGGYYGYNPVIVLNGNNYNLIGHDGENGIVIDRGTNNSGGGGDIIAPSEPLLEILQTDENAVPVLADHGGNTDTILPMHGSPVLNAIPSGSCYSAADQRGIVRPIGGGCDIGAVEADFGGECTLHDKIIAANLDTAVGNCPAGDGADVIQLDKDEILLNTLPIITSTITIEGNNYSIDGDRKYRIFWVKGEGDLTLNNITLFNGQAPSSTAGGALFTSGNVQINNSTLRNNSAFAGGAIANRGTLTINQSTLSNNSGSMGGAIHSEKVMVLNNSTIANNSAVYNGGGIHNRSATATLNNSTVTGNRAGTLGGGIDTGPYYETATLHLNHSIISGNSAAQGSEINQESYAGLTSYIHANNYNIIGHSGNSGVFNDPLTEFNSGSNGDLIGPSQTFSQILEANVNDKPVLADNGGSTKTVLPIVDSPAINLIPTESCLFAEDQRSEHRPQGLGCDVGAVEVESEPFEIFLPMIFNTSDK